MNISRRNLFGSTAAVALASSTVSRAMADAPGADALKSTLNPFGGIRAGNAAGTIPSWTGEVLPLPAGYVSGDIRPDPFASDPIVVSISAANMAEHEDKLTQGDIYLLKTYPDYRVNVYSTHRTAVAPQYVYDYTYKNATTAQLLDDGNGFAGAYGGVPFPIPTTGKQLVWNHLLRFNGVTNQDKSGTYQVTSAGELVTRSKATVTIQWPYYFNGRESEFNGWFELNLVNDTGPAYVDGEAVVFMQSLTPIQDPSRGWEYLLGERRVRLAPQLTYDTPIDTAGGVINWDEGGMFYGAIDKYDCAIVGKREMYVPYNTNKLWATTIATTMGPKHVNPDVLRMELHRVWVVEMTLAPGKRNVDARRTLYIDEDTWTILAMDIYDASGTLWKYHFTVPVQAPEIPAIVAGNYLYAYDFHSSEYVAFGAYDGPGQARKIAEVPASFFTPGELAALAGGS